MYPDQQVVNSTLPIMRNKQFIFIWPDDPLPIIRLYRVCYIWD